MISIIFHLLLTLGILWYQERLRYRAKPWQLSLLWYGVSLLLVFIETAVLTGRAFSGLFAQGAVVAVFYVPAAFFSFRWAEHKRKGLAGPMAVFMTFAIFSTLVAALFLARAEHVRGLPFSA
jgi:hypothetical protein